MFLQKKEKAIDRYNDPTGELSNRSLRIGTWYVAHKLLLRRIGTILLMVWCVLSIGYGLVAWGHYLIIGLQQDTRMAERQVIEFQDYAALQPRYSAAPLQVQDVRAIAGVPGRYDLFAQISNPNERWVAFVEYRFRYSEGITASAQTALLPGARRPILVFGQEATQFPVGVVFEIVSVQWWQIDPHLVSDVVTYAQERIVFAVENVSIVPAGFGSELSTHRVEFDLTNESAYSYVEAPFYILLRSGGAITGVLPYTISHLRAGETVHVDLRTGIASFQAAEIEVIPLINIYSPRAFSEPEG